MAAGGWSPTSTGARCPAAARAASSSSSRDPRGRHRQPRPADVPLRGERGGEPPSGARFSPRDAVPALLLRTVEGLVGLADQPFGRAEVCLAPARHPHADRDPQLLRPYPENVLPDLVAHPLGGAAR